MISIDKNCTACGACAQVCPASCIGLLEDVDGFIYPVLDDKKCIECNLCVNSCHLNYPQAFCKDEQHAYAAVINSSLDLNRSTSGGAFTAIARYILNKNGVVYGCAYVGHLQAKHIRIDSVESLTKLNGSKYVQSSIGNSYLEVKRDLESGLLVLFSGTPCQVAGLKVFLGKEYDGLITIDLVCHGVPAQSFFDKYIKWYEKKHHLAISDYSFRSKDNSGWSLAGVCQGIDNRTNGTVRKNIFYYKEYYYYYFLQGYIYREGCYSCKYASRERVGDFTLGDFWGAEGLKMPFSISDGCSLILTNKSKAMNLLSQLDCSFMEIPIQTAVINNKQLVCPSKVPMDRGKIIGTLNQKNADECYKLFLKTTWLSRMIGFLKYHIPKPIKRQLITLKNTPIEDKK